MAHQQHENTSIGHYTRRADSVEDQNGMLAHHNGNAIGPY